MKSITVAIADDDAARCARLELSIEGKPGIRILRNATTEGSISRDRRRSSRANITAIEDLVARIRRLIPRILLAGLDQCSEANCAMLSSLRVESPGTLVVLLVDEPVRQEERVMQALSAGARGYLDPAVDLFHVAKAVEAIDRGEAWVSRRMLGCIMDRCHGSAMENRLDPAC